MRFYRSAVPLYVVFFCLASSCAFSSPVTPQQASLVVRNWLARNARPMKDALVAPTTNVTTYRCSDGTSSYHVVSLSPSGFVVVPTDNKLEPILCFGLHGTYEPSKQNPLTVLLDQDIPKRLASSASTVKAQMAANRINAKWQVLSGLKPDATSINNSPGPSDVWVAPLVASQWSQSTSYFGNCYNYWTPNNDVCGCVATALAQLIRYFQWPTTGVGTSGFTVYVDGTAEALQLRGGDGIGGPYVWSEMPLTPDSITTDSPNIPIWYQEIGDLCYDAGVAESMQYTAGSSGAWPLPEALTGVFHYGNAMYSDSPVPYSTLTTMINPDLDAGLPVVFSIYTSDYSEGHCVLGDGYGYDTGTMYHHLNVGWGSYWYGSQSIWYNLANPDLTVDNYSIIYAVDYNIYPQGTGEVVSGMVELSGAPLQGAVVKATSGGNTYTTTSGSHGIYAFAGLPSNATYTVSATYDGATQSIQCPVTQSVNYSSSCGNLWGQNINIVVPVTISPSTLPAGTEGEPYSQTITASGGTSPYTFAVTSGSLPAGLTLSSSGALLGTPTAVGSSSFTVTATDSMQPLAATGGRAYTMTINPSVATTTKLVSAPNASIYGASVTLTATISPSVPNGETVTFNDDGTSIGTGTTSGGKASFATSALAVGSHSITASYPGDANYASSTSSMLTQSVVMCHPVSTVVSSVNPSSCGQSVTFNATVSPNVPNGEVVTFYQGTSSKIPIGTGTTLAGVATFSTSTLAAGSNTVWAYYPGDSNHAYSWSSGLAQTVNKLSTSVALTSSLNPAIYGTSVTFTATTTPTLPNGETLTFYNGSTAIGTGKISSGKATLSISALSVGSNSITASYPGDSIYAASASSTLTETVSKVTTATSLTTSAGASTYSASVMFTASIIPNPPNGETVTFNDGGNSIGTGTTSGGKAMLTMTTLALGSHSITAGYPGDANYGASTSSGVTETILIARPTTALVSSLNPSTCNSPVTFTATISMSVPNGETVNFYDGAVSKALIGTGTTSGNVATLTTSVLASGSHTIWADYVGDANHAYSWSSSLAQTVNKVPTATLLSSSVNPSTPGALVTFTAALTPSVPNGETVTFLDGVTAIGTAKTSGGKATFGTAALGLGVHTITASYSGDANYSASVSSALSQTINQAPTVTTVASSFNASTYGAAVTFTATIAPSTPGGQTVTFYDGGSSIGTGTTSGGKAAFTTELLAVGAHSITASYPGDTTYLGSTSGVLTQTVVICHPVTTLTSSLNPSTSGASVTFTATVGPGVPNGAIVTFYDGTTSKKVVGTGTISSGTATLSTSALASGSHTIWAYYPGDSNHAYSWSGGLAQSVN